mmetsp:Transcript_50395/g.151774  ORF Transcript_50395/g.151774 Transcript_50395/m.151774 type:complete len:219 (-) Transcript_50395:199-855(-)
MLCGCTVFIMERSSRGSGVENGEATNGQTDNELVSGMSRVVGSLVHKSPHLVATERDNEDQGNNGARIDRPRVRQYVLLRGQMQYHERANASGDEHLDGEDGIHSPYECHARLLVFEAEDGDDGSERDGFGGGAADRSRGRGYREGLDVVVFVGDKYAAAGTAALAAIVGSFGRDIQAATLGNGLGRRSGIGIAGRWAELIVFHCHDMKLMLTLELLG